MLDSHGDSPARGSPPRRQQSIMTGVGLSSSMSAVRHRSHSPCSVMALRAMISVRRPWPSRARMRALASLPSISRRVVRADAGVLHRTEVHHCQRSAAAIIAQRAPRRAAVAPRSVPQLVINILETSPQLHPRMVGDARESTHPLASMSGSFPRGHARRCSRVARASDIGGPGHALAQCGQSPARI